MFVIRETFIDENPNFLDVPSNLPFFQNLNRLWKTKIQTNSSLKMTIMPSVALQGFEKIELTLATSCKDREFSIPLREDQPSRLDCLFLRKSEFFVRNEKLELSGIMFETLNLTDLFSIRLRENILRLATCCCVSSIFVSRVSSRNGFSKLEKFYRSFAEPVFPVSA